MQSASPTALQSIEWQQGTTPLMRIEPLDNGRPIAANQETVVRMVIGPSATNELFSAAESTVATNDYYLIQWPTIGTNTASEAWWYTVYFEENGHRYWTGNGELFINATTSTAQDGLVWIDVICTTNMFVPKSRTVTINGDTQTLESDIDFTVASVAESDPIALPIAYTAITNAAAAQATADSATTIGTNALAVAEAALTAESDTLATVTARDATTTNCVQVRAMEIGSANQASGNASMAGGADSYALGKYSIAFGTEAYSSGICSYSFGFAQARADWAVAIGNGATSEADGGWAIGTQIMIPSTDAYALAWSGDLLTSEYKSHGPGTFNINPVGGLAGFYVVDTPLSETLSLKANAETIYTGAVCPASSGTQYYWTTATNVTLSVGTLTAGKPVNIAKINNSSTNSITAIGEVGWEWTGGEMTNTIPAGKSMTFGFLIDAATGKTNAYATGVSK